MKRTYANKLTALYLGRRGENLARQVIFDLSEWVRCYGEGRAELICQRPGEGRPYPAEAERRGDELVWTLTAADTAAASVYGLYGRCELRWYVGQTIAKSRTWRTVVEQTLDDPADAPPAPSEPGWVERLLAMEAYVREAERHVTELAERGLSFVADIRETLPAPCEALRGHLIMLAEAGGDLMVTCIRSGDVYRWVPLSGSGGSDSGGGGSGDSDTAPILGRGRLGYLKLA